MSQTSIIGRAWAVVPQLGDLTHAEGALLLDGKNGYLRVTVQGNTTPMQLSVDASSLLYDTTAIGVIGVPIANTVIINDKVAWSFGTFHDNIRGIASADCNGFYIFFRGVTPAHYSVITAV